MSSTDMAPTASADLQLAVLKGFNRKQMVAFGVPAVILVYLTYVFFAFDISGIASRARLDNAAILVSDFWSHKTHVTRDNRDGAISVAIEGETKGTYPPGMLPEWVTMADSVTRIDLDRGHEVIFDDDGARYIYPGYGVIDISPQDGKLILVLPDGGIPGWINASDTRIAVTTKPGRFSYTRNRTEVFRYQAGWELFFFTLDSPFYGKSFVELVQLATVGERVDPNRSNISAMAHGFWTNAMWRHGDVAWALFETVLMAFLGTMGAAMIALPLAFFAATNFSPSRPI
ncbi:MAG: phosphonate ABC transporter, permease protein PhnE, partial [Hoeflea sp.]|nr:phosphonate ABC transporter, permease protein PhnE [Hoeflea sp.]